MYFSLSPSSYSSTSYSNTYSTTSRMEIPSSSGSRSQSPSCAFPSWPRRSSLSSNSSATESSSFISDEELFPCVFDDADCTPPATPSSHSSRSPASPSMMVVVDHGTLMRQLVAEEKAKKERRRRKSPILRKSRTSSGGSKHMSPIQEVGE